jgi:hypothetical protein
MGGLHNELRRSPLGRALKNALGDSTSTGQLERFGETLQPTIDLWAQPDWAFLRGEQLWAFNQSVAAVAGEIGGVAVVNPAGSNRIVIVTAGTAERTVAGSLQISLTTEAVITATYALFAGGGLAMPTRDSRIAGVALRTSLPQFWTGTNVGALTTTNLRIEQTRHLANEYIRWISPPIVLSPGFALLCEGSTANEALSVGMVGTIRPAFRGELAP